MKKAAIFDLDGTIAETLESIAFTTNTVLKEFGFGEIDREHLKKFVGNGARTQMKRSLHYLGCDDENIAEKVGDRYLEVFEKNCLYHVTPCAGVPELLTSLHEHGVHCAVLSNKPHARTVDVVDAIYPEGTFEVIRGQLDGFPKKPAPDGAIMIASILNVKPEECLYLGDTNTDMQTGRGAGMFTIGVLWGFREKEELEKAGADAIALTPADVLKFL